MFYKLINIALAAGLVLSAGCAWLKRDKSNPPVAGAKTVARGARTVAVKTARAGALVSRLIAAGTYKGSRKAVTWTGERTKNGTAATLELFGLIDRPVPPDVLERLPDDLVTSLTSLEFVKPVTETTPLVIKSPDLRWEGEVLYRLELERSIEVECTGPRELIVVTLATFKAFGKYPAAAGPAEYSVYVEEDAEDLGEVSFEAQRADYLSLYGYQGWEVSAPGVFVIKAPSGSHRYSLRCRRLDSDAFLLISFFLPHYETGPGN